MCVHIQSQNIMPDTNVSLCVYSALLSWLWGVFLNHFLFSVNKGLENVPINTTHEHNLQFFIGVWVSTRTFCGTQTTHQSRHIISGPHVLIASMSTTDREYLLPWYWPGKGCGTVLVNICGTRTEGWETISDFGQAKQRGPERFQDQVQGEEAYLSHAFLW